MLNCPFCGGQASHGTQRISDKQTIKLNGTDTFYFINCVVCGADNQGILGHKTIQQAEDHWNKRYTDIHHAFLNKALLTNPINGERMEITKTEGIEKGNNCLVITVEGITGAFEHRIFTTEV
ncbi:MAG: Lar family restriction alleviation protein [Smithella sp.]|jgi:transcription elongation factor Elf1